MRISVKSIIEKIIWLLTVFLLSSFLIFESYTWGRYAFFGATVLIALLSAVVYDGIMRIRLGAYHGFFVLFILYVAINSLWAMRPSDTVEKAMTLAQIFLCAAMLYIHYDRKDSVDELLSAVKWAGYVVTLYAIAFYGLDAMLESSQDIRLENEFSNVNSIAMAAALACMIQWKELLAKKSIWATVMVVPAVILITATQSRKAFVMLLAGIVGIYVMHTLGQKGTVKKVLKLVVYMLLLLVAMQLLLRLPIFSGALERMTQLFNFFTEDGKVDHSTILRNNMIELGIENWKKYPLFGMGMGNPHILAARYLKFDAYLHNNFVELLCGGGVAGFCLYYAMYGYLLVNLFKYRKADPDAFGMGLTWLILMLVMNYGMVTYYSKAQWYYLLIHFINVNNLRNKHREMLENDQESVQEGDELPVKS